MFNQNKLTYHSVSLYILGIQSNNESYDYQGQISKINVSETLETECYEYNVNYGDIPIIHIYQSNQK